MSNPQSFTSWKTYVHLLWMISNALVPSLVMLSAVMLTSGVLHYIQETPDLIDPLKEAHTLVRFLLTIGLMLGIPMSLWYSSMKFHKMIYETGKRKWNL